MANIAEMEAAVIPRLGTDLEDELEDEVDDVDGEEHQAVLNTLTDCYSMLFAVAEQDKRVPFLTINQRLRLDGLLIEASEALGYEEEGDE